MSFQERFRGKTSTINKTGIVGIVASKGAPIDRFANIPRVADGEETTHEYLITSSKRPVYGMHEDAYSPPALRSRPQASDEDDRGTRNSFQLTNERQGRFKQAAGVTLEPTSHVGNESEIKKLIHLTPVATKNSNTSSNTSYEKSGKVPLFTSSRAGKHLNFAQSAQNDMDMMFKSQNHAPILLSPQPSESRGIHGNQIRTNIALASSNETKPRAFSERRPLDASERTFGVKFVRTPADLSPHLQPSTKQAQLYQHSNSLQLSRGNELSGKTFNQRGKGNDRYQHILNVVNSGETVNEQEDDYSLSPQTYTRPKQTPLMAMSNDNYTESSFTYNNNSMNHGISRGCLLYTSPSPRDQA
eukprot:TRINITY_DN11264_c0_g1_i2.p1 TRINITY_DN11264_c0_g1~~TRINITY_DN11264_c0_g1_i2.p1  ORF type:complete len:358 (-),score=33.85 TRINITY_DN11264_c0_g1_i2:294-1367(-)